jgi:hypothetical protein
MREYRKGKLRRPIIPETPSKEEIKVIKERLLILHNIRQGR